MQDGFCGEKGSKTRVKSEVAIMTDAANADNVVHMRPARDRYEINKSHMPEAFHGLVDVAIVDTNV